jgi:hypothetical protein
VSIAEASAAVSELAVSVVVDSVLVSVLVSVFADVSVLVEVSAVDEPHAAIPITMLALSNVANNFFFIFILLFVKK